MDSLDPLIVTEEREVCCCGARGWTLVIGWLHIIYGVLVLLVLVKIGVDVNGMLDPEKDLHSQLGLAPAVVSVLLGIFGMVLILAVLTIIMAAILICGRNNKNPQQLSIWIIYTKILLVLFVLLFIGRFFIVPVKQDPSQIFTFCAHVAIQGFCIWVVGIHKREIEASSGSVFAYKD